MARYERTLVLITDDRAVLRAGLHLLLDAQPDMLAVGGGETAEQAASIRESLTHSPEKSRAFPDTVWGFPR